MKKPSSTIIVILALLIIALLLAYFQSSKEVSYDSYKTASYQIEGRKVVLGTEGTKYFGNEAKGDLNGDGQKDVAFLITYEPGGSGTFFYVVSALKTANGYVGTNARLVGDRIAPQTTSIQEGDVIVNYAERAEGQPMTAQPSVGVTNYYKVVDGKLVYEGSR